MALLFGKYRGTVPSTRSFWAAVYEGVTILAKDNIDASAT
jgi:hypothetical protein